ncbi:hypothetical protein [Corynebacterium pseudogenitalium]|uniref:hypothetical protein n=1 Tax=Corynebacterium pseudogenitalium TaxID=38303 RepID=UPI003BA37057
MKKFTTAAVAATMALGLTVPTAGAAEGKSSDGAYWTTTVVSGDSCKITDSNGTNETITRDQAKDRLAAWNESQIIEDHAAYLRGDANSHVIDFALGEIFNANKACANGQNYSTNFVNSLSSVVEAHEGRAAAYWLSIIVPGLLGIAALGAAFSPEFRHMLPAPVLNFLNTYFK